MADVQSLFVSTCNVRMPSAAAASVFRSLSSMKSRFSGRMPSLRSTCS